MPPVMRSWGVTSKAGFQTPIPAGERGEARKAGIRLSESSQAIVTCLTHSGFWDWGILENLEILTPKVHEGMGFDTSNEFRPPTFLDCHRLRRSFQSLIYIHPLVPAPRISLGNSENPPQGLCMGCALCLDAFPQIRT